MGYGFNAEVKRETNKRDAKTDFYEALMTEMADSLFEAADYSNRKEWDKVRAKLVILRKLAEEVFAATRRFE